MYVYVCMDVCMYVGMVWYGMVCGVVWCGVDVCMYVYI